MGDAFTTATIEASAQHRDYSDRFNVRWIYWRDLLMQSKAPLAAG